MKNKTVKNENYYNKVKIIAIVLAICAISCYRLFGVQRQNKAQKAAQLWQAAAKKAVGPNKWAKMNPQGKAAKAMQMKNAAQKQAAAKKARQNQQNQQKQKLQKQQGSIYEQQVSNRLFNLTNQHRAKNRRQQLKWDNRLARVARNQAIILGNEAMKRNNIQLHHNRFRERTAAVFGKNLPRNSAENVAANFGHKDVAGVAMQGLKNSPGHNRNMLDTRFTHVGTGVFKNGKGQTFLAQVFGRF